MRMACRPWPRALRARVACVRDPAPGGFTMCQRLRAWQPSGASWVQPRTKTHHGPSTAVRVCRACRSTHIEAMLAGGRGLLLHANAGHAASSPTALPLPWRFWCLPLLPRRGPRHMARRTRASSPCMHRNSKTSKQQSFLRASKAFPGDGSSAEAQTLLFQRSVWASTSASGGSPPCGGRMHTAWQEKKKSGAAHSSPAPPRACESQV